MSKELDKAFALMSEIGLTPQEDKYARDVSKDLIGFVMKRCSVIRAGIRTKAVVAAVAITLQAIHDIEQDMSKDKAI